MLPAGRRPHSGPRRGPRAPHPRRGPAEARRGPQDQRAGDRSARAGKAARTPGPPPPQRGPPGGCRSRADGRGPRAIAKAHDGAAAGAAMGETRTGTAEAAARARTPETAACGAGRGGREPGRAWGPAYRKSPDRRDGHGDGWGPREEASHPTGRAARAPQGPDPETCRSSAPGCGAAAPQSERSEPGRRSRTRAARRAGPLLDKRTVFHQPDP